MKLYEYYHRSLPRSHPLNNQFELQIPCYHVISLPIIAPSSFGEILEATHPLKGQRSIAAKPGTCGISSKNFTGASRVAIAGTWTCTTAWIHVRNENIGLKIVGHPRKLISQPLYNGVASLGIPHRAALVECPSAATDTSAELHLVVGGVGAGWLGRTRGGDGRCGCSGVRFDLREMREVSRQDPLRNCRQWKDRKW